MASAFQVEQMVEQPLENFFDFSGLDTLSSTQMNKLYDNVQNLNSIPMCATGLPLLYNSNSNNFSLQAPEHKFTLDNEQNKQDVSFLVNDNFLEVLEKMQRIVCPLFPLRGIQIIYSDSGSLVMRDILFENTDLSTFTLEQVIPQNSICKYLYNYFYTAPVTTPVIFPVVSSSPQQTSNEPIVTITPKLSQNLGVRKTIEKTSSGRPSFLKPAIRPSTGFSSNRKVGSQGVPATRNSCTSKPASKFLISTEEAEAEAEENNTKTHTQLTRKVPPVDSGVTTSVTASVKTSSVSKKLDSKKTTYTTFSRTCILGKNARNLVVYCRDMRSPESAHGLYLDPSASLGDFLVEFLQKLYSLELHELTSIDVYENYSVYQTKARDGQNRTCTQDMNGRWKTYDKEAIQQNLKKRCDQLFKQANLITFEANETMYKFTLSAYNEQPRKTLTQVRAFKNSTLTMLVNEIYKAMNYKLINLEKNSGCTGFEACYDCSLEFPTCKSCEMFISDHSLADPIVKLHCAGKTFVIDKKSQINHFETTLVKKLPNNSKITVETQNYSYRLKHYL